MYGHNFCWIGNLVQQKNFIFLCSEECPFVKTTNKESYEIVKCCTKEDGDLYNSVSNWPLPLSTPHT